ncbi:internalin [Bifidobacterium margollesii]|uniref:Internalin n=1 Tax=Bifidobacterium margollesii TaxID=2020964 RepID=A0A2N5J8A4_9BIFI|nr:CAP domain-containing protein [Bifidobacterium margollesii]PLS30417.1 internalin [Bifidobacterium margollesii]
MRNAAGSTVWGKALAVIVSVSLAGTLGMTAAFADDGAAAAGAAGISAAATASDGTTSRTVPASGAKVDSKPATQDKTKAKAGARSGGASAAAGDSSVTGVALGGGTVVYATDTVDQPKVYQQAIARVVRWRRDALNDKRIRIDGLTIADYLAKSGISQEEYLSPKWSNTLERVAIQRAIEAYDYSYGHVRLNGESCFSATVNGNGAYGEILAWGSSSVAGAIDLWASEKGDYIKMLNGQSHGQTGHYEVLIQPAYEAYGFAGGSSSFYGSVYAGEAGGSLGGEDTKPTNLKGTYAFPVAVSDALINQGTTSNIPGSVAKGAKINGQVKLRYGSGRYVLRGSWSSADSSVISTNAAGNIVANANGSTDLYMKTNGNGKAYVFPVKVMSVSNVYRVYNRNSGLHHYTTSAAEKNMLVRLGWRDEGTSFRVAANHPAGSWPVYREYNRRNGTHNWTMNSKEHNMLVRLGWKDEGVAWYVMPDAGTNVYRLYNRNSGEHVYTTSGGEYVAVQRAGWRGEGVAWRGL